MGYVLSVKLIGAVNDCLREKGNELCYTEKRLAVVIVVVLKEAESDDGKSRLPLDLMGLANGVILLAG